MDKINDMNSNATSSAAQGDKPDNSSTRPSENEDPTNNAPEMTDDGPLQASKAPATKPVRSEAATRTYRDSTLRRSRRIPALVPGRDGEFFFAQASSSQIREHWENTSQAFAGSLATTNYVWMQTEMEALPSSLLTSYWVIFESQYPNKVVSSCSMHLRDAFVNVGGQGGRWKKAAVIRDVFTLPEYRRRGLASVLLDALNSVIDDDPGIAFSVVFSDMPVRLFSSEGWAPQEANQLRILLRNTDEDDARAKLREGPPKEACHLYYDEYMCLMEAEKAMSVHRVSRMRPAKDEAGQTTGPTAFAYISMTESLVRRHLLHKMLLYRLKCVRPGTQQALDAQYIIEQLQNDSHASEKRQQKGLKRLTVNGMEQSGIVHYPMGAQWTKEEYVYGGPAVWLWWEHDYDRGRLMIPRMAASRDTGLEMGVYYVLKAAI
ncbi:hypothetical protein CDD80_4580 [Ophiocordyceps camponoti-rufipedis]|uniref:N-acetyltransferase domain-containing protein n=1 Tax=Ophiocordyceps camponoti-rufipedis TaxID=2004952 RepID=A0A2C5YXZ4_9HYPO|nr:hypothetical protein CDD80_4580 [Ophiocordyceps camponoti-rufipedis]